MDNGEWAEGWYYESQFAAYIIPDAQAKNGNVCNVKVDLATVGQYTGLQDKNGKKIFEGDIVLAPLWKGRRLELTKGLIEFSKGAFSAVWQDSIYGKHFAGYVADMEVIGNIFDNPELWEEQT